MFRLDVEGLVEVYRERVVGGISSDSREVSLGMMIMPSSTQVLECQRKQEWQNSIRSQEKMVRKR